MDRMHADSRVGPRPFIEGSRTLMMARTNTLGNFPQLEASNSDLLARRLSSVCLPGSYPLSSPPVQGHLYQQQVQHSLPQQTSGQVFQSNQQETLTPSTMGHHNSGGLFHNSVTASKTFSAGEDSNDSVDVDDSCSVDMESNGSSPVGEISEDSGGCSPVPHRGVAPQYRCDVCNKVFAIPARLMRHQRIHTGEKPFCCEYCNKTFSVKENLNVHRRIHTKERPYSCTLCGRAFEHSGKLHRHMRTHTGERPHKCEVCGKTFVQSGQLVIHMRAHTGEKPYSCDFCTKAFTCSKQLKVHLRTHTGEKPYGCDVCGKTFGYNHVLKMHKMSHLGEKLYKCTLCDQFFSSRKALDLHIREHADENGGGSNDVPSDSSMDEKSCDMNSTSTPTSPLTLKRAHNKKEAKPRRKKIASARSKCNESSWNNPSPYFGENSPSSDYTSDDSGRGNSPISLTLPESPETNQSPYCPSSLPNHHTPSSEESRSHFSPILHNTQTSAVPNVDIHSISPTRIPTLNDKINTNNSINSSLSHSLTELFQKLYPTMGGSDSTKMNERGVSCDAPKIAVFTTQSGERVACPVNLLLRLGDCGGTGTDNTSISQLQKEIEMRLLREESRRAKEGRFCEHVVKVLQSLLGQEKMVELGHPDRSVDDIIRNTLEMMRTQPCTEPSLAPMDRIKVNLRLLLECCVPDQDMWIKFGWKGKSIEDIVYEFLDQC